MTDVLQKRDRQTNQTKDADRQTEGQTDGRTDDLEQPGVVFLDDVRSI